MEQFGIKIDAEKDLEALRCRKEMQISADDSRVKVFVVPSGENMVLNEDVASILGWK
jgi:acetate kinase